MKIRRIKINIILVPISINIERNALNIGADRCINATFRCRSVP